MSCRVRGDGRSAYVENEIFDVVALVEALEPVEPNGDDVVRVVEEAQVHDGELLAGVALAEQVPGPVARGGEREDGDGLVVLGEAVDGDAHLEALVEALVVGVVGGHAGDEPQLLRVRRHQRRPHHERAARQHVLVAGAARVGDQRPRAHARRGRDRRPRQPDEDAQPEAREEGEERHHELALAHRVEPHVDRALAAVVVVGRRDVFVELAEQVAELRQRVADPQAQPSRRQVVGIAQPRRVRRLRHFNHFPSDSPPN